MIIKIAVGSDHAGFTMKENIRELLQKDNKTYRVKDYGCFTPDSVDYPDIAHAVALGVGKGEFDYGLLFCGSANGMAMTSNKHVEVRAAVCWNEEIAALARQHNDANILCVPARFTDIESTKKIVGQFLRSSFEGGRHKNRIRKIGF